MIIFLELTDYETGDLTLVNFNRVNRASPSSHPQKPGATLIEYEADDYFFVSETYAEVHAALRAAVVKS